jgi:hypothetical protein
MQYVGTWWRSTQPRHTKHTKPSIVSHLEILLNLSHYALAYNLFLASTMRSLIVLLLTVATALAFPTANTTQECPTSTEYACFDVINSSLCLSQNAAKGTAEQMAACVTYDGAMSSLSGAAKVSSDAPEGLIVGKLLTVNSCVVALDVILKPSTMRSRNYSRRRVQRNDGPQLGLSQYTEKFVRCKTVAGRYDRLIQYCTSL